MAKNDAKPLPDDQIIDLYWQRDERAIRETDRKYRARLMRVALNILHDLQDSEECLNDTYVCAWNSIPPARPTYLQAFLISITRRGALNRYKAARRQKRVPSELTSSLSELDDMLSDGDQFYSESQTRALAEILEAFIAGLPERRMLIFMGRYYAARPVRELAELLGCSESTVNKEIAAIKRELRAVLENEGYTI